MRCAAWTDRGRAAPQWREPHNTPLFVTFTPSVSRNNAWKATLAFARRPSLPPASHGVRCRADIYAVFNNILFHKRACSLLSRPTPLVRPSVAAPDVDSAVTRLS
ncbi:hypothetical protein J6590_055878 [Homalodisca vitripennis]|nr:hypothetical protein J6590_055878 [Homalodisca vitripennis]